MRVWTINMFLYICVSDDCTISNSFLALIDNKLIFWPCSARSLSWARSRVASAPAHAGSKQMVFPVQPNSELTYSDSSTLKEFDIWWYL